MGEALDAVLSVWHGEDPARGRRAAAVLGRLLASRGEEHGAMADSALTLPGCPWELAFASADPSWRYTVEPGPPDAPQDRLDLALGLLADLGAPRPDGALLDALRSAQRGRPLRQGAHIGARHGPGGDRFKLYVELPSLPWREAEARFAPWLRAPLSWHGDARGLRAAMLGLGPGPGRVELYGGVEGLHAAELATLMAPVGLEARAPEVLDLIEAGLRWPGRPRLPGAHWGFSHGGGEGAPTFTVYTMTRTLYGPDGASRATLLDLSARRGLGLGHYARISAPLAGRMGFMGCHGMVGVVVQPDGPLGLWVGLAPPGCGR